MSYKKQWIPSPNFTPGPQTQAIYGRPRTIELGAGHWWNTPEAGATHDGVVNIFQNPAREASAHAVLSKERVTEMVRAWDTAWTTGRANPYTYSIEVDPRIMYKWGWGNPTRTQKALGHAIFETLAEYIADKNYQNLTWYPHKRWADTQCNPIHWNEVMIRAKQIHAAKNAKPTISWLPMDQPRKLVAEVDVRVYDLKQQKFVGETIKKGTVIDFKTKSADGKWLRSRYSTENKLDHGLPRDKMAELAPLKPEWIRNLKDIKDIKLMVLTASATIYDLNNPSQIVGSPIPQGTWIDVAKQTLVKGETYLISSYSVTNAKPHGILQSELGLPKPEPVPEPTPEPTDPEPEWLKNWQDIVDIAMYTRQSDVEVVNLLDGSTADIIKQKGTKVDIASSTEWMGQKYLITAWSTDNKKPHGIRLVDLDIKPVPDNSDPIPEDPDKPVDDLIRDNNSLLQQILALLQKIWNFITGK